MKTKRKNEIDITLSFSEFWLYFYIIFKTIFGVRLQFIEILGIKLKLNGFLTSPKN